MIIRPYLWTVRTEWTTQRSVQFVHEVHHVHHFQNVPGNPHGRIIIRPYWHASARMLQSKALEHQQDV
jgi:hypothetical protein